MTRSSTSTIYSGQGASATVNNVLAQPDVIAAVVGDNLATSVTSAVFGDATSQAVGGAILYQTVHPGDEFTDGDISARAEGAEYQLVRLPEPDVRRDPVEDLGGKFICTEEAVTRNVLPVLTNGITQVSASIRRAIDGRTIDTLEAAVAEYNLELPGHNWSSYIGGSEPNTQRPVPAGRPRPDAAEFRRRRHGAVTSTLIVHPNRPPPCASPTAPTSPTSSTPPAVSPSTPRPTSALATPTSSPDSPAASESRPHSRCR